MTGILYDFTLQQYADFLDEIQWIMVQLASCGNQFRSQNKNFSYKNNLANQILMQITKGEWSEDRRDMAKCLKPRLLKLLNNVFYL